MTSSIHILAIDDEPLVLEGLQSVIQRKLPKVIFHSANEFDSAQNILKSESIDVVLLDLDFRNSQMDGFQMADSIRQLSSKIKIIVLTVNVKIDYVEALFNTKKVDGYLDKNLDLSTLDLAITEVMNGKTYLAPELIATVERGRWYTMSKRERQVVELLTKGLAKKQVADHLCISISTVDSHVRNLFKRFEVNTTQALVAKYVQYISVATENASEIAAFKNPNNTNN